LLAELSDHIDDAVAALVAQGVAAADAVRQAPGQIGAVSSVVGEWRERTLRGRRRRAPRIALTVALATTAGVLGVTSAADGHREPARCAYLAASSGDCGHRGATALHT
jgi:hypothetical protein